ncbi:hypothetical protein P0F65_12025 [Sphingomonas sp. I4]
MRNATLLLLAISGSLVLAPPVAAQSARSDDNRLRLDPGIDRRTTPQERAAIEHTEPVDRITIDGQVYTVGNTLTIWVGHCICRSRARTGPMSAASCRLTGR